MRRKPSKKHLFKIGLSILSALVIYLLSGKSPIKAPAQLAERNQPGLYKVLYFDDGDTIAVSINGRQETVSFIGVDTPPTWLINESYPDVQTATSLAKQ